MQIDSIKMQDLREKTPSKRRGNKICLRKKGKTDGEEGRKLWPAEKFHTVEIYLTQREARLRGQTLDTFIHEARGGVGSTGWVCDAEYATVWPVFRE